MVQKAKRRFGTNLLGIPLRDHFILGAGDTFVRVSSAKG